jgi:hypothetical protein
MTKLNPEKFTWAKSRNKSPKQEEAGTIRLSL